MSIQYLNPKHIDIIKEHIYTLMQKTDDIATRFAELRSSALQSDADGMPNYLLSVKEQLTDLMFIYNTCCNVLTSAVDEYGRTETELKALLDEIHNTYIILIEKKMLSSSREAISGAFFDEDQILLSSVDIDFGAMLEGFTVELSTDFILHPQKMEAIVADPFNELGSIDTDGSVAKQLTTQTITLDALNHISVPLTSTDLRKLEQVSLFIQSENKEVSLFASQFVETMTLLHTQYPERIFSITEEPAAVLRKDALEAIEKLRNVDNTVLFQALAERVKVTFLLEMVSIAIPAAALMQAMNCIADVIRNNTDDYIDDVPSGRTDISFSAMSADGRLALRALQLAVAAGYNHEKQSSVTVGENVITISEKELLKLMYIITPEFEQDSGLAEIKATTTMADTILPCASRLREVAAALARSADQDHIEFMIHGIFVNVPAASFLEIMNIMPVDYDQAKAITCADPKERLDELSFSATSALRTLQTLPLLASEYETMSISYENKTITLPTVEITTFMHILPVVYTSSDRFDLNEPRMINQFLTIDPVIYEFVDIIIEPVQIWPWVQFQMGLLLPVFRSASYMSFGGGLDIVDGIDDGAVDVAEILSEKFMSLQLKSDEDSSDEIMKGVINNFRVIISALYDEDDSGGISAVAVGDVFDIEAMDDFTKIDSPVIHINDEKTIDTYHIFDNEVFIDPAEAMEELPLPKITVEDADGIYQDAFVVPPHQGITRFDAEVDSDSVRVNNAYVTDPIDISKIPSVAKLVGEIASGDFINERDVDPAAHIQTDLTKALDEAIVEDTSYMEGLELAISAIQSGVAVFTANVAYANESLTYETNPKATYISDAFDQENISKETYTADTYEAGPKTTYNSDAPDETSAFKDINNGSRLAYTEAADGVYVGDVHYENNPNNDFIIIDYIDTNGTPVRVCQPKGIRFLLRRLYEMFISLCGKIGNTDEEAMNAIARSIKKLNADIPQTDAGERLAVFYDEEENIAKWLQSFMYDVPDGMEKTVENI